MESNLSSIDTASLLELSFMLEASIDVQFQAWMALSFAVIVAAYSAKNNLLMPVRTVMAFTYAVAAYALFARWMTEWIRLDSIHSAIVARGIHFEPAWYAPEARIVTYLVGSAITIGAIFYFGTRVGKMDNIST